jgi:hypothetical protein
MKHLLVSATKFVQIKALGSKLALPQGVIDFPNMYLRKKNLLLKKNTNSYRLDIKYEASSNGCLPSLSNENPGVKFGPALGGH